ncbi:hypothetical protein KR222_011213 [Zaprionus bogoriensis]|nr:hypothetical protein KR222_011213 [Zaprionus bogoriensis]
MSDVTVPYGGCVVAMCGANCVAIGTDHRLGIKGQTLCADFKKVFHMTPHLMLGITGLQSDILTVRDRMIFRKNIVDFQEDSAMTPKYFRNLLSGLLYEHRFGPYYVDCVIAGLDEQTRDAYICNFDPYGFANEAKDFVVSGTCALQLYGMCETLWQPDMQPNQLFEVISQSMIGALDRDALCGWGATVYVMEHDKLTERSLKTRMD